MTGPLNRTRPRGMTGSDHILRMYLKDASRPANPEAFGAFAEQSARLGRFVLATKATWFLFGEDGHLTARRRA